MVYFSKEVIVMDELKYRVLGKDEFIYMEKVRCDAYDIPYHKFNKGYFEELYLDTET